ncbi:MAG: endonuclease/exonuclease/phosphatase family protein [Acidimicrobiales bacterium]
MRIATWNLERKTTTSPTGAAAVTHLGSLGADILVLTEARLSFPAGDGFLVSSRSWGSDDERKVVMWSRKPWRNVDDVGSLELPPHRFVAATTDTESGPVHVIGVCISWHMANVVHGDRNRKPWEDHIAYCACLRKLIDDRRTSTPLVVAGDFNQRLRSPPQRGARHRDAIANCLDGLALPTAGIVPGWDREENDHIATAFLRSESVHGWPKVVDGVRMSDHAGVVGDFFPQSTLR